MWENREYPDRPEMLPISKTPTVDSQNKSDFDTKWAYDTSIALSSVFKAYPELTPMKS